MIILSTNPQNDAEANVRLMETLHSRGIFDRAVATFVPPEKVEEILDATPEASFYLFTDEDIANKIGLKSGTLFKHHENLTGYTDDPSRCADVYFAHLNACRVIQQLSAERPETFTRTEDGKYVIFRNGDAPDSIVEDPVSLDLFAAEIISEESGLAALMGTWLCLADRFRSEDRYASMLANYINQDAEATESEYVLERMDEIGLTDKEAEKIGLGWLTDLARGK